MAIHEVTGAIGATVYIRAYNEKIALERLQPLLRKQIDLGDNRWFSDAYMNSCLLPEFSFAMSMELYLPSDPGDKVVTAAVVTNAVQASDRDIACFPPLYAHLDSFPLPIFTVDLVMEAKLFVDSSSVTETAAWLSQHCEIRCPMPPALVALETFSDPAVRFVMSPIVKVIAIWPGGKMELRWPEQDDDRDEFIAEAMDWEQAWLGDCCDEEGEYDMDKVILKLNHRFSGIEGPFRGYPDSDREPQYLPSNVIRFPGNCRKLDRSRIP